MRAGPWGSILRLRGAERLHAPSPSPSLTDPVQVPAQRRDLGQCAPVALPGRRTRRWHGASARPSSPSASRRTGLGFKTLRQRASGRAGVEPRRRRKQPLSLGRGPVASRRGRRLLTPQRRRSPGPPRRGVYCLKSPRNVDGYFAQGGGGCDSSKVLGSVARALPAGDIAAIGLGLSPSRWHREGQHRRRPLRVLRGALPADKSPDFPCLRSQPRELPRLSERGIAQARLGARLRARAARVMPARSVGDVGAATGPLP
jgi:hypothetical protein